MIRVNRPQADPTGWIGAGLMIGFAAVAGYRWHTTGLLFFALTMFRDVLAAGFLVTRWPVVGGQIAGARSRGVAMLAYVSSAIPLFYFGPAGEMATGLRLASEILVIAGYALATLALIELGRSFGISPANRGLIKGGIYRHFRHPMYVGYCIAEAGLCLINFYNAILLPVSLLFYFLRSKREQSALALSN